MGVIFKIKNSQLLTWSLPTKEMVQVNDMNRPMSNLLAVDFRSQPRKNAITKVTEYVTFCFSCLTLVFFPF